MSLQGTYANVSGKELEGLVEAAIRAHALPGDRILRKSLHSKTGVRDNILLTNVPYKGIYGATCRSEFVLCLNGRKIRIECKRQQRSGSVDEKGPYLVLSFLSAIPEDEAIIVLSGNGFREGVKDWVRRQCAGTKVQVFSLKEFVEYAERGFPRSCKAKLSLLNRFKKVLRKLNPFVKVAVGTRDAQINRLI